MFNIKPIVWSVMLLLSANCYAQKPLDNFILTLKQANFIKIYNAKDSIINYQALAIPELIELLNDTSYVKLVNTADLIYPGSTKYYGHGWIVNYDLDRVNVRAAWILEAITFRDFGYEGRPIIEDSLLNIHKQNYSEYLTNGFHKVDPKSHNADKQVILHWLKLASAAKQWWTDKAESWTRFNAIKEALQSTDVKRQQAALYYLRERVQSPRSTKCDFLTTENFYNGLYPLIEKIGKQNNEAKSEADFFLVYNKNVKF